MYVSVGKSDLYNILRFSIIVPILFDLLQLNKVCWWDREVGRAAVGKLYPTHDVGVVQDRQEIKECDGVGGKRHWE